MPAFVKQRSDTIQRLKFLILKSLLMAFACLPLPVVHGLAGIHGMLLYWLPTRAKATTRVNLSRCFPSLTEAELSRLTRKSLLHTAMTAFEMGKAWLLPMEQTLGLIREIEGGEILKNALDGNRGVIVLAPHLGNWEFFGFHICETVPSTFLYQPPRDPALDRLIKQARSRGKARLAPTSRHGVAELLKALKLGEVAGVLPDQEPPMGSGMFADFFGVPALTMTLVSRLIEKTGARVICGFAMRLPGSRGFKLVIRAADPEIYSSDTLASVAALNRTVESVVNLAKEQYQWEYKRFKRRPYGERFY